MLLATVAPVLVPLALAARGAAGRWLRPGAMFAGYWAVAGGATGRAVRIPWVSVRAIIYIFVAVLLFSVGAVMVSVAWAHRRCC